jgi:hypothetical protein
MSTSSKNGHLKRTIRPTLPSKSRLKWADIGSRYNLPNFIPHESYLTSAQLDTHRVPERYLPPSFHQSVYENAWDQAEALAFGDSWSYIWKRRLLEFVRPSFLFLKPKLTLPH